jgi:hypothetical protein
MGFLYFFIRGTPVADVPVLEDAEGFYRHLINFAGEAADPRLGCQFIEAADTIFVCQESYVYGMH